MIPFVTQVFAAIARRALFWVGLALIFFAALRVASRQGRHAAKADFAIRRAEARIRALQTSKEIHHAVQNADRPDLEHRVDRWMRD